MNSKKNALSSIEMNPSSSPIGSIIWLHGLGASGEDFVPVASELLNLTGLSLRFVFPHAPSRPVTINNGYIMPAWYDITSFDQNGKIDHQGITDSVDQVQLLIENEKAKGLPSEKIIIAGFSQGAVIALSTLFSYPDRLAGVIALSGYLLFTEPKHKEAYKTPIFLGHGIKDNVVPYFFGQRAYETLKEANYPVTWRTYAMPHSVCNEEIRDMGQWLKSIYPKL